MQGDDRTAKGIADILEAKRDMDNILSGGKGPFLAEKRSVLAVRYLLIEAVEAITDVCQHLLARIKGVACNGYVDCIVKAGENGIIKADLARKLRRLADLRNSLIHRYWVIDDGELFEQCIANKDDLSEFCEQVRRQ